MKGSTSVLVTDGKNTKFIKTYKDRKLWRTMIAKVQRHDTKKKCQTEYAEH